MLGVVFIGAGTSLLELALSVRAAADKRASMSVGNVSGSDIVDLLIPVGLAAVLHSLSVEAGTISCDLPALFFFSCVLLFSLLRRRGMQRHEALTLAVLYGISVVVRIGTGLPGTQAGKPTGRSGREAPRRSLRSPRVYRGMS